MKTNTKVILLAILSFFAFYLFNQYILCGIGFLLIIGRDSYELSYHMPSYTGIALIASLIVTYTYIIIKKINVLLEEIKKIK
ncbi:hypothetical protein [Clostridium sp. MD294]|uniref:hypothetical protein n=1 Tax=Clostridium sp. MD294 TaxID=97138 RepID=UPI0002CB3190|nr:hypothetical protein [Clostridium sp. MD294]NDO46515.1 hypothetical protein [Clostridium sp. MD294]USF29055.1 hypothetical protein C820_000438 [Clostridium sp. MD294]